MQRSFVTAAARAIRNTARTLMRLQSRAETTGSGYLDTNLLSEHMRRDVGLMDGQEPQLEARRATRTADPQETTALTRLYMTPHAS
ncbi:hypothetical protein RB623_17375 [Mesorhizobium sp. LHD-90]|uniref:hypothetical protein n=1 Tax=Mesorhizobium sp. LHD-90 TaxID=3071414 RepID=UPI0027E02F9D|nr:hypothetical protein [Mesorhizobium sp. LHD-90]MDQ6435830.1 hypothetical protein [Mesorhizobium sp. LHD-90]